MIGGLSLPLPAAAAPAEAELESVACSKAAKKASSAALKPSPPLLPAVVEGSGVAVEEEASESHADQSGCDVGAAADGEAEELAPASMPQSSADEEPTKAPKSALDCRRA
jgi:hypothetical protein